MNKAQGQRTFSAFLLGLALLGALVACGHSGHAAGSTGAPAQRAAIVDGVHITQTGSKFHTAQCRFLDASDAIISRSEALARGLTPCSVCMPETRAATVQFVHITQQGLLYHKAGCQYLRSSDITITKQEALRKHYKPCSVCGG